MQNSLERLLTGMATALHERVLPLLDDRAAAAQVTAAIELLGNLSTRVTWDVGALVTVRDRVTPVLAAARDAGAADVVPGLDGLVDAQPPDVLDADAVHADVVARLAAFGRCQAWAADADAPAELRDRIDAVVDAHLADELDRLRSASFGRPPHDDGGLR